MKIWVAQIARFAGLGAACITLVAGAALHLTVPTMMARALVVGACAYVAVYLFARLAGDVVLRAAIHEQVRRHHHARASAGDNAPEASGSRFSAAATAPGRTSPPGSGERQPAAGSADAGGTPGSRSAAARSRTESWGEVESREETGVPDQTARAA